MLQPSYDTLSKGIMQRIFTALDNSIDSVVLKDNVISVDVPHKGTFVVNRQPPKSEIWLSSPISGPYHFKYKENKWTDFQGNDLLKIISEEILDEQHMLE
ncbi:frataxin [Nematocida minor]|uniref:frataxin n=1 Tax=Nematocida minor TaxID=1912983 RepID=UPI002220D0E1|nr:frataxin [Nematocida minor]KAI5192537.1 frataxin [Nematocida minor]